MNPEPKTSAVFGIDLGDGWTRQACRQVLLGKQAVADSSSTVADADDVAICRLENFNELVH